MSEQRVLSTEAARDAVRRMQQIINGPLSEQIDALHRQGEILCQPDVWDGFMAQRFREEWHQHVRTLRRTQETLDQIRRTVERFHENIMSAGGQ